MMTVADLIARLAQLPGDLAVYTMVNGYSCLPISALDGIWVRKVDGRQESRTDIYDEGDPLDDHATDAVILVPLSPEP